MKLGLISDIHGNLIALEAVIKDARQRGVTHWWALGDLVALGPDPVGVLRCLAGLDNFRALAGNTERYVLRGDRPYPSVEEAAGNVELVVRLAEVATSFAWTRGALTHDGWLEWLDLLPASLRIILPDGTRILGVHASPGSDDGQGIDTQVSDEVLADLLRGCEADVVFGGHTHDMTDRTVEGIRAVNLGSVSNSNRSDRFATYAILDVSPHGHMITNHIVSYDLAAALEAIDKVRHPTPRYLKQFLA